VEVTVRWTSESKAGSKKLVVLPESIRMLTRYEWRNPTSLMDLEPGEPEIALREISGSLHSTTTNSGTKSTKSVESYKTSSAGSSGGSSNLERR